MTSWGKSRRFREGETKKAVFRVNVGFSGVNSSRCSDHDGSVHRRELIEFLKENCTSLSIPQVLLDHQEQRSEKGVGGGSVTGIEMPVTLKDDEVTGDYLSNRPKRLT